MWNDHRLHWFYPLHWSPAVPSNAQKLPHRYIISQHPHSLLLNFFFPIHFILTPPPTPTYLHPNRNDKKVSHGGGSSYRAERICQNRTERGEHEQLRAAAAVFCPLLAAVGYEVLQQSVNKDFKHFTNACQMNIVQIYFYCAGNDMIFSM